ncbi:F0F1 ATP synthase subunit B [Candidatus Peregrinibacteria bacterium]|nr:F0F1 ATP synthase subunit B [Candidatus Peregrinibacteria bacterium]
MSDLLFIPLAFATTSSEVTESHETEVATTAGKETESATHEETTAAHSGGIEIQPTTVAFQGLNFLALIVILYLILYKPLTTLLDERAKKIKEGVENADKAEVMLKETQQVRHDMMKSTQVEANETLEKARKSGETLKNSILQDAHQEAGKIVKAGHSLIDMEKDKVAQELKAKAVNLIVGATEKILREKLDASKDAKLIEENLKSFAS